MSKETPIRQIRASYDDKGIRVYQAYRKEIAKPALAANRFVPPFCLSRMTWIKPSFLWMMYRSGWALKEGQQNVLAVTISRKGFEWAIANASLSHFVASVYDSHNDWKKKKALSPVRIQWDPERNIQLGRLEYRSIQIGLGPRASEKYVNEWTISIDDVTPLAHKIHKLVKKGEIEKAKSLLPLEQPYPLSSDLAKLIGATE